MSDVSDAGAVVSLGDGEHRVRFPVRNLISLEDHFDGIRTMLDVMSKRPVSFNFDVLKLAFIDGETWTDERIETAIEGVEHLELAQSLGQAVMARLGYTTTETDSSDPTQPESSTSAPASSPEPNDSTGQG